MAQTLDAVCGMTVDLEAQRKSGLTSDVDGKTYAFCSPGCKATFDKQPAKYAPKVAQWEAAHR